LSGFLGLKLSAGHPEVAVRKARLKPFAMCTRTSSREGDDQGRIVVSIAGGPVGSWPVGCRGQSARRNRQLRGGRQASPRRLYALGAVVRPAPIARKLSVDPLDPITDTFEILLSVQISAILLKSPGAA